MKGPAGRQGGRRTACASCSPSRPRRVRPLGPRRSLAPLAVAAGTFETIGFTQIYNMMEGDDDREPGDFGFDPLGLLPGNEEQYKTAELTHGRAAMLAFSAVATQSALPASFGFGQESFPYF